MKNLEGTSKAKARIKQRSDTVLRKCGEQTRLDTLVVHTVNDEY